MEDNDADVVETEHGHCASCFLMSCTYQSCRVVECKNKCGMRYHQCKEQDHLEEICSEQVHDCFFLFLILFENQEVKCLNAQYGCDQILLRRQLGDHLVSCPASVVICTHTWNRWPLSCRRYQVSKKIFFC